MREFLVWVSELMVFAEELHSTAALLAGITYAGILLSVLAVCFGMIFGVIGVMSAVWGWFDRYVLFPRGLHLGNYVYFHQVNERMARLKEEYNAKDDGPTFAEFIKDTFMRR